MFAILIMLIVLIEIMVSGVIVFFLMKSSKKIVEIDKEINLLKKETINIISDYRVSVRMLNVQVKIVKTEIQTKQIFDMLNLVGTVSLFLGLKKKSICK